MKELTREQLLISELLKLEQSEGWKHIVDVHKSEKKALMEQIMAINPTNDEKLYSANDLSRNMILYIDWLINAPSVLKWELEPMIETQTPNL